MDVLLVTRLIHYSLSVTLAATAPKDGKCQCHNCGKQCHWAKKCCFPKKEREESTDTSITQVLTTHKPENKPVGFTNILYNFKEDGFWMAIEKAVNCTNLINAEPDLTLGMIDFIDDV